MKTALVILGLLTLLAITVGWAIWGWEQTAGTAMGFHGWLAMILGIVFTVLVGCGLMALMFYSSRHGYDDAAGNLSETDEHWKGQRLEDVAKMRLVETVDNLLKAHLDADGKVLDAKLCKDAIITALGDAYEQGLQDGLATKKSGPDA